MLLVYIYRYTHILTHLHTHTHTYTHGWAGRADRQAGRYIYVCMYIYVCIYIYIIYSGLKDLIYYILNQKIYDI